MKTKTKISLLALLLLLLAGGAVLCTDTGSARRPHRRARRRRRRAVGAREGRSGRDRQPALPAHDEPTPGQGKARVETAELAGGAAAGRVINWSTGDGVPTPS